LDKRTLAGLRGGISRREDRKKESGREGDGKEKKTRKRGG